MLSLRCALQCPFSAYSLLKDWTAAPKIRPKKDSQCTRSVEATDALFDGFGIHGYCSLSSAGSFSPTFLANSQIQRFCASFVVPSHIFCGCYFGFQQVKHLALILAYSWKPGVEGIFLVFAMKNVTSISLHYLLLSAGTLLPIVSVVCIFAISISNNKEVCMLLWRNTLHTQLESQGVFESIQSRREVPPVQQCHLRRDTHHLLAPPWLRHAAVKHSYWHHSPLKPYCAHCCCSFSLSVCYIQVKPQFLQSWRHCSCAGTQPRLWR